MIWDVIGAIAVVVSLIYLAVQIRQNNLLMRATAKQSLTEASQNMIYKMSDYPECWVKLMSGEEPATTRSDGESHEIDDCNFSAGIDGQRHCPG